MNKNRNLAIQVIENRKAAEKATKKEKKQA